MTTMSDEELQCAVCRGLGTQTGILATSACGSADLDGCSPEVARSAIAVSISCCPHGGYCPSILDEASTRAGQVMACAACRQLLTNSGLPDLARRFLFLLGPDDDEMAFWKLELGAVYDVWRRPGPGSGEVQPRLGLLTESDSEPTRTDDA